jgi:hypothetical protein
MSEFDAVDKASETYRTFWLDLESMLQDAYDEGVVDTLWIKTMQAKSSFE